MKIYHTEYFSAFLKHLFGESRVFFLNFEDIIKGDLSWIPLFFDGIGQISESIMITNNNAKRMTRDVVFTGRKKTLKMAIERNLRGRRKVLFCFFKTRIGRHILKFFNAIPLGEIVLRKPSESEKVYLYKKMRDKAFL
jgi:hypothetical protein